MIIKDRITRQPADGRSGKVVVADEFDRTREFYWDVFPGVDFNALGAEQ